MALLELAQAVGVKRGFNSGSAHERDHALVLVADPLEEFAPLEQFRKTLRVKYNRDQGRGICTVELEQALGEHAAPFGQACFELHLAAALLAQIPLNAIERSLLAIEALLNPILTTLKRVNPALNLVDLRLPGLNLRGEDALRPLLLVDLALGRSDLVVEPAELLIARRGK